MSSSCEGGREGRREGREGEEGEDGEGVQVDVVAGKELLPLGRGLVALGGREGEREGGREGGWEGGREGECV